MRICITPLTDCFAEMACTLSLCKEFLIEAISQLDELKTSQISLQKQLIKTQEELEKSKTEQLQCVQAAVRDELKDWAEASEELLWGIGNV